MTATVTNLPPPNDEWCQCGYRRSAHDGNDRCPHTQASSGGFKRSQMFNDTTLPEGWAVEQKWVKAAERKARGHR